MKRVCGFAISHTVTHYYSTSHRVTWSVVLSFTLTVCHTSEPFEQSTVLWTFHTIQPSSYGCPALKVKIITSSSAIAEGPRDALSQLKSGQLLHNCTKNHIWLQGLPFHVV